MNINFSKEYTEETCIICGLVFFFPSIMHRHVKDTKLNFFCPSGHSMAYVKSKADIIQENLNVERKRVNDLQRLLNDQIVENETLKKKNKTKKK